MNRPTFLTVTLLAFLVCVFISVHGTTSNTCHQSVGNLTCIQKCNGSDTCNSSCPTQQGYRECLQQCSSIAGCPGNYQCLVPSFCSQECYDGSCYCNTENCTQTCSTSYCKNTAMACHSGNCRQTCSGDCNLECTRNASGICNQDCTGTCRNTSCEQKKCIQKTNCRNPPCSLHCSSNVDDCQQTCSYGKCKFECNAKHCKSKCNSGMCMYEGTPQVNTNNECDKVDTLSKQCFQEGCGWPNCSLNCANGIPGLVTGCSQNCMEPTLLCPKSMVCSYEDCMQNCFGQCQKIICHRESEKCGQLCEGKCDVMQCNATTHCLQHCSGECNTIECSSTACLQSCKSKNCTMKCNENVANCSQSCTTEEQMAYCFLESKALLVEHQSCKKNCTSMKCGENSAKCTQSCGEGCARMVCSSASCEQECTNGGCELICTSSVKYCKQTCVTGNCTLSCSAQYCENCTTPECLLSPTTSFASSSPSATSWPISTAPIIPATTRTPTIHFLASSATTATTETTSYTSDNTRPHSSTFAPTTSKITTTSSLSTTINVSTTTPHPGKPTTGVGCEGETSAQRKIENLIKTKDDNLVILLCIAIGIMALLVLVVLIGFICVLKKLRALQKTSEPQLYNIEGKSIQGYENTAF